jgi:hypothetical protein
LANFYRKLIKGFSQLAKPLLDFLKKKVVFQMEGEAIDGI